MDPPSTNPDSGPDEEVDFLAPTRDFPLDATNRESSAGFAEGSTVDEQGSGEAPFTGTRFGDYELLGEVARGGMGIVYRARHTRLDRIVAVKMILARDGSDEDRARFLAEAEAAATLDHPAIVPVHDIGDVDGQLYFSMGYVDGPTLAEELFTGPLPPRDAAELVARVAEAVHFAHERGIVHRDLKPSNILLDGELGPRVSDFGLAKRMDVDSGLTVTGQVLGTPSFMPPEQATGDADRVGPAADVYALGSVLYAACTGRPPFAADTPLEILRQVVERDPVAPRSLNSAIPRDLETITLRCLEKDPRRRYDTAAEVVADLRRFLDGRPIVARPAGPGERLWRWSRRQPVIAGLLVALFGSLVGGLTVSWRFAAEADRRAVEASNSAREARNAARRASDAEQRERERREQAERQARIADANRLAARARELEDRSPEQALLLSLEAVHLRPGPGEPPVPEARAAIRHVLSRVGGTPVGDDPIAANRASRMLAIDVTPDDRFLWIAERDGLRLASLNEEPRVRSVFDAEKPGVHSVSVGGNCLAVGSFSGEIRLFDTSKLGDSPIDRARAVVPPPVNAEGRTVTASFRVSASGRLLVRTRADRRIEIWDVRGDDPRLDRSFEGGPQVVRTLISADERVLVAPVFGEDRRPKSIAVWRLDADDEPEILDSPAWDAAVSPDSRWLVGRSWGRLRIHRLEGGESPLVIDHEYGTSVRDAVFAPDSRTLAVLQEGGTIDLWEFGEDVRRTRTLVVESNRVHGLAFGPLGRFLAVVARDNEVRVWDLRAPNRSARVLRGHDAPIRFTAFRPGGVGLVTVADDGTARTWSLRTAAPTAAPITLVDTRLAVVTTDGERLVSGGPGNLVRTWRLDPAGPRILRETTGIPVHDVHAGPGDSVVTPNGRWLFTTLGETLWRWDLGTDDPRSTGVSLGRTGGQLGFTVTDPAGRWICAESPGGNLHLWRADVPDPARTHIHLEAPSLVNTLRTFSEDGGRLAVGNFEGAIHVWDTTAVDVAASRVRIEPPPPADGIVSSPATKSVIGISVAPDGHWLAATYVQGGIRAWRLDKGREPELVLDVAGRPRQLSIGGETLCAIEPGRFRLWSLATPDREPTTVEVPDLDAGGVDRSGRVVATHAGGEVRAWPGDGSGESLLLGEIDAGNIVLGFTANGRWILGSNAETTLIWPVRDEDVEAIAAAVAGRTLTDEEREEFGVRSHEAP